MYLSETELRDCRTALVAQAWHHERITRDKASDPWQIDAAHRRAKVARTLARKIGKNLAERAQRALDIAKLNEQRGDAHHFKGET